MFESSRIRFAVIAAMALCLAFGTALAGLQKPVTVVYDEYNVPTIRAESELDAIHVQGYMHAKDRFFQMDVQRHLFSGTLAELVGPSAIPQDVQLRTLGLRRAAERSLAVQTPEVLAWLQAYADGVNAFLTDAVFEEDDDNSSDDGCEGSDDSSSSGGASSDDSHDGDSDDSSDDNHGGGGRAADQDSDDSGSGDDSSSGDSVVAIVNPLPLEYGALELTRASIAPWTPLDSLTMVKGLAFGLSFDLGDIDRTLALLNFLGVGPILGFNGLQLYTFDLYRTAPFDPTISIPTTTLESSPEPTHPEFGANNIGENDDVVHFGQNSNAQGPSQYQVPEYLADPSTIDVLQSYRDTISEFPILDNALVSNFSEEGSNWWIASGANTVSGFPMMANDPHLSLGTPATFYEAHLQVVGGINVTGSSFPGAPGVVIGCNDTICWGATVNPLDVTDVYREVLLALGPDPFTPTHTLRNGVPEPLQFIPQTFLFNAIGDAVPNNLLNAGVPATSGGVTLIVPRRNNGPIVQVQVNPASPTPLIGISVQYTGWSGTQELETFRRFARATNPTEFKEALQYFDVGSQNWAYVDVNGNIGYYTSAELPIREDLQKAFFPAGLQPPYFIRDGTHTLRHEWLPIENPQPHQALGTEILPFAEMPQLENPASGIILNANNDPIGTSLDNVSWNEFRAGFNGRLYLSHTYEPGYRIGRIQKLFDDALSGGGKLSLQQFKEFQANNQLLDAEALVPHLAQAYSNAQASSDPILQALAADAGIQEAIGRLTAWDFSTPTGIDVGFDPGDDFASPGPPDQAEIDASVAATIYAVWRGQVVQRVVDSTLSSLPIPLTAFAPRSDEAMKALRQLLEDYPNRGGTGLSLLQFFRAPGTTNPFDARDAVLLQSLQSGLSLLASNTLAAAFNNSTNQEDYRWGYLHRIVFAHPLGSVFNIPAAGSPQNVSPSLVGFARAGGMGAVDASSHAARADGLNEFMFSSGPARRFITTMQVNGPQAFEVLPGGESGLPGNPSQTDQLELWLVNDYKPLPVSISDVLNAADSCQSFVPAPAPPPASAAAPSRSRIDRLSDREESTDSLGRKTRVVPLTRR